MVLYLKKKQPVNFVTITYDIAFTFITEKKTLINLYNSFIVCLTRVMCYRRKFFCFSYT